VPSTPRQSEDHAYGEENSPDGYLQEYVQPEDRVDGSIGLLFGKLVVVVVRASKQGAAQRRKYDIMGGKAHGVVAEWQRGNVVETRG
jgi:hypothetical protein